MPAIQLVFSTRSVGNGEIAKSNRKFKSRVQVLTIKSKGDIARENLEKLFKVQLNV